MLLSKLTVLFVVVLNLLVSLSWRVFTGFIVVFGRSDRERGRELLEMKERLIIE